MFADIQALSQLTAVGYSAGGGLGMGVSPFADCLDKYKRNEGGVDMCADGNATDNWDTPPAAGWGYYNNSECAELCTMRRGSQPCCAWSISASLFFFESMHRTTRCFLFVHTALIPVFIDIDVCILTAASSIYPQVVCPADAFCPREGHF